MWNRTIALGLLTSALMIGFGGLYIHDQQSTHVVSVRFEWDSTHGFTSFNFDADAGEGGHFRCFMVASQIKPILASYLRRGQFSRARGDAQVRVTSIIPLASPEAWGSGGLNLDTDVSPLMEEAEKGDLNSVKKLLADGADVNAQDWLGRTSLLHACMHGNVSLPVLEALIAAGADVNRQDKGGLTPLTAAITTAHANDRDGIILKLVESGADVNAKDASGGTALMQAAVIGDIKSIRLLLRSGALVGARAKNGVTALSLAEQHNQGQAVDLLRMSPTSSTVQP